MARKCTVLLEEIGDNDTGRCGGKAVSLGRLARLGMRVPPGFCIEADALDEVIRDNDLQRSIAAIVSTFNFEEFDDIEKKTAQIRALIEQARLAPDLRQEIIDRHRALTEKGHKYVAVRSSVALRGTMIASFPGMMDTYHYVLGHEEVLARVRECWASLWSARAAYLRHHKRLPHEQAIIAPVVQAMVNPDTAGVLFTANPVSKSRGEFVVEANWGLGESVVSGKSMNDYFVIDKASGAVLQRKIAVKSVMVVMDETKGRDRSELPVPMHLARKPTLDDNQLEELVRAGTAIEQAYGYSVDVEWAYQDGVLYVLQARKIPDLD